MAVIFPRDLLQFEDRGSSRASVVMSNRASSIGQITLLVGSPFSGLAGLCDIFRDHPATLLRCDPEIPLLEPSVPDICTVSDGDHFSDLAGDYVRDLAKTGMEEGRSGEIKAAAIATPGCVHDAAQGTARSGPGRRALNRMFGWADAAPPDAEPSGARSDAPDGRRLVIGSTGLLGRLPLFAAAMPGIRVILIIRNPFGHVSAMLRANARDGRLAGIGALLATSQAKSYGLSEKRFASLALVEQFAWNWAIRNEIAIGALAGIPEWRIVLNRDFLANPVKISKALFEFANLAWHPPACLRGKAGGSDGDGAEHGPYGRGFADSFVQAFDDMTRPLYGGTGHYGQPASGPCRSDDGWAAELAVDERQRILTLVQSTSLGKMFPNLDDFANVT